MRYALTIYTAENQKFDQLNFPSLDKCKEACQEIGLKGAFIPSLSGRVFKYIPPHTIRRMFILPIKPLEEFPDVVGSPTCAAAVVARVSRRHSRPDPVSVPHHEQGV